MESRSKDWLAQAENDLAFAENALASGFYAQCCFICQQVAEKSIKSLAFHRGAKATFTHSLFALCQVLQINGELERACKKLDKYYISARYPDAFPGGAPFQLFEKDEASEAVKLAVLVLETVRDLSK